jgi:Glycosyl hydrolases family 28
MRKDRRADTELMSRRSFLAKAGLIVAGSSICSSVGCGASVVPFPCLGPAAPPTPVPGMKYIRASDIGCALDCDLETGRNSKTGGEATDDGPRINAAMAGASASNPITLIIDGGALISGLFLPAGGYWGIAGLGCGTGFYIKSGTNNDGIHNGPANAVPVDDPGPPAPARGSSVSLSNFTVNGNRGNGHDGDSTSGAFQGPSNRWYFGINLMSLDNITIENVVVVDAPAYQMRLSNVGHVTITGCVVQGLTPNSDGIHFDGPANDISIANCELRTADDSIALNCPEGYTGNISRVNVTGCTFQGWSLMRLYTSLNGQKFLIDTVNVSNCKGTLTECAFVIGWNGDSLPNSVTGLTVSDCTVTAPTVLAIAENFGTIVMNNVTLVPSLSDVVWFKPQPTHSCGFLRPSPTNGGVTYTGSSLTLQNCQILRNKSMDVAIVIVENGSTINNLEFDGFAVNDFFLAIPEVLTMGAGAVGQLVINSLNSKNIRIPTSPAGFGEVGQVSGTGVLATGWEFPDSVMANGVPYISASTGKPSIKVNGVVEPYNP